jgi:Icc protein
MRSGSGPGAPLPYGHGSESGILNRTREQGVFRPSATSRLKGGCGQDWPPHIFSTEIRIRSVLKNGHGGVAACLLFAFAALLPAADSFHFVLLGDRTGETQPGVYERVWAEATRGDPAFVVSVGDTIQGLNDATAEAEWQQVERILAPFRKFSLYLTPGNHDIWSEKSARLFREHAGHPPHYSFDYGPAHFTILDNSRSDELQTSELAFLEEDLKAHAAQPLKFIVSHRPSWIFGAAAGNSDFRLHQLARKYGVQYVIAGHLHEMLHYQLEGIDYVSLPSAGGHLRASGKYQDGWFFGFVDVNVRNLTADLQIHELRGPVSSLREWGPTGLK